MAFSTSPWRRRNESQGPRTLVDSPILHFDCVRQWPGIYHGGDAMLQQPRWSPSTQSASRQTTVLLQLPELGCNRHLRALQLVVGKHVSLRLRSLGSASRLSRTGLTTLEPRSSARGAPVVTTWATRPCHGSMNFGLTLARPLLTRGATWQRRNGWPGVWKPAFPARWTSGRAGPPPLTHTAMAHAVQRGNMEVGTSSKTA